VSKEAQRALAGVIALVALAALALSVTFHWGAGFVALFAFAAGWVFGGLVYEEEELPPRSP
jgi:hypothetical protein